MSYEAILQGNKEIGLFMEVAPEIEYVVGSDGGYCFSPKNCGSSWWPEQKMLCENFLEEQKKNNWIHKDDEVIRLEWYPNYNISFDALLPVFKRTGEALAVMMRDNTQKNTFLGVQIRKDLIDSVVEVDIEESYLNVLKFIRWYRGALKNNRQNGTEF
jgi:hypothetical protein